MQSILSEDDPGPKDLQQFKDYLNLMSGELERCGNIVSGLLSFARESKMETRDVELNEILKAVISLTQHKIDLQDVRLTLDLSTEPLAVKGDVNQLQQCFLNLVFNAIEAMPQGGHLAISSKPDKRKKMARVVFQDSGTGIAKKHLDHIFDPFFTTKKEGDGTGLGLSIVYGIVKSHRGHISVKSTVGKGTTFTLHFPIA
jgi:signal transduction histidine kinase